MGIYLECIKLIKAGTGACTCRQVIDMKNYKLQKRAIEKNKFHEILIIAMFALFTVSLLYSFLCSIKNKHYDALNYLSNIFSKLPYLQIFLIFFAFEICQKMHRYCEAVSVTKKGVVNMYKTHLGVIATYVLFLTLEALVITLAVTFLSPLCCAVLFLNVILSLFFYFFLGCLAAVFIGFMFSFIKHKVICYFLIILIALSGIPFLKDVISNIYSASGINIIKLFEIFTLYPSSMNWANYYHTGIVINNSKVELILFWIVFSVFIFILKQKPTAVRYKAAKGTVCLILCAALMTGYLMPFAMIDMGNGPSGLFANEEYYQYNEGCQTEEAADFKVTKYKLDLSAYRILKARADIYVDKNNLSEYKFTLYHGYKVTKVTDQGGKKLDFSQETDYLTVLNSGNSNIEFISVEYKGDGNEFYSNHSGMLLTGNFAYYPVPGYRIVFERTGHQGILDCSLDYKTEFDVTVNNLSDVFCNLDEMEENHFTGKSDSVTVISGFIKSIKINDTEIYYPYLDDIYNEEYLKEGFESFIEKNHNVKKIFILPNISQSEKEGVVLFDDYLITSRDYDIEGFVLKSQTSYEKTDLAGFMAVYATEDEEQYWIFCRDVAEQTGDNEKIELMDVLEEVLSEGDEETVQQIKDYLVDNSDKRTPVEFLESLR